MDFFFLEKSETTIKYSRGLVEHPGDVFLSGMRLSTQGGDKWTALRSYSISKFLT